MCRYAIKPLYKKHYACFACRKSWKRRNKAEVDPAGAEHPARCPECRLLGERHHHVESAHGEAHGSHPPVITDHTRL